MNRLDFFVIVVCIALAALGLSFAAIGIGMGASLLAPISILSLIIFGWTLGTRLLSAGFGPVTVFAAAVLFMVFVPFVFVMTLAALFVPTGAVSGWSILSK